ncbi:MAG: sugar ABC transporter substrate-binding protein [Chloroflexi bacterium]|nr:sugar ABC transporter substrate-binding protein [Chloroflexota bacterium]
MTNQNETTKQEEQPARFSELSRRGFLGGLGIAGMGGLLAACGGSTTSNQSSGSSIGSPPNGKRLKAAYTNNNLGATWCAQGKQTAETWGKWFGVDVTWYDGGGSVDQQRKALDDIATKKWDFVAIQAVGVDTLIDPVKQLIDNGIPVIQMDTEIDSSHNTKITTFLEPDNVYMGEASSTALFEKIGGKGNVIMTWGALGHTGAQGRAKGFKQALAKYPDIHLIAEDSANWDVNQVTQLWENYLVKYKDIAGGFFHNDDMALAGAKVIQNAGRNIPISGVDAMQPAIQAVLNGTMVATVRNPSCRIHWGAMVIGILAATGVKNIPTDILADGPVVTQRNAQGLTFMEDQFLL